MGSASTRMRSTPCSSQDATSSTASGLPTSTALTMTGSPAFSSLSTSMTGVGRFWSRTALREALAEHTTIPMVPSIYTGPVTGPDQLRALLETRSAFRSGDGKYVEGVYLRIDDGDGGPWLQLRAKLVRADFVQNINEGTHWTKTRTRLNK